MTDLRERTAPVVGTGAANHLRRRLVLAGVLVLAVLSTWLVAFSSVLGVRTVMVSGTGRVSVAEVQTAAAITPGTPLARLDTAAIRARVAAIPAVRTVSVGTTYPSTVTIRVTERVAVGYRSVTGGALLVDVDDVGFATVGRPPAGLPRLDLSGDQARDAATALVAGALPAALARKIAVISAPSTESVTLRLTDDRIVLWGGTDRSTDKARLLPVLFGQPGRYFDVSDPSSVISRGA
ncbi:MAG: cell division protein FtsQ/DivIB [Jatrophihabitans sp.]